MNRQKRLSNKKFKLEELHTEKNSKAMDLQKMSLIVKRVDLYLQQRKLLTKLLLNPGLRKKRSALSMAVSISKELIESEVQLVKLEIGKEKHTQCQQPMKCKQSNRIVNQKIIGYQDNLRNHSYRNQLLILQIHSGNL